MPRTTQYAITHRDLNNLLAGEGGVDLQPITENGRRQPAMRIVGVTPGTTAARLGAENGDTIESINEMPLVSVDAAYKAAEIATRHAKIVVRGKRNGEPYETTLTMT